MHSLNGCHKWQNFRKHRDLLLCLLFTSFQSLTSRFWLFQSHFLHFWNQEWPEKSLHWCSSRMDLRQKETFRVLGDDYMFFYHEKGYVLLSFLTWNNSRHIWTVKGYFHSIQSPRMVAQVSWLGLCLIIKTELEINKGNYISFIHCKVVINNCSSFIQNILRFGSITNLVVVMLFFILPYFWRYNWHATLY